MKCTGHTVPMPGLGMCFDIPDGPGVVLPELVGVLDFVTGVPGLSCCNSHVRPPLYAIVIPQTLYGWLDDHHCSHVQTRINTDYYVSKYLEEAQTYQ